MSKTIIHSIYKFISLFIWMTSVGFVSYLLCTQVIDISDAILSFFCISGSFFVVLSELRKNIKLCVLWIIFAIFYFQFININVSIKYLYSVYKPIGNNIWLLYILYGLGYIYTFYQQWLTLFLSFKSMAKTNMYSCFVILLLLLLSFSLLVFAKRDFRLTNILLYYIPIGHCAGFMLVQVISRKNTINK